MSTHRQTQITAKDPLIAIEGGIGAGKSTLGRWIRRNTSGHYVDEYMSPMLPSYFVDPHRYALAVQVDSIVQRTRLLKAAHDVRHAGPIWLDRSIYGSPPVIYIASSAVSGVTRIEPLVSIDR